MWVVYLNRTRSDRIAEANVDLDGDTRVGDRGASADAHAAILEILADRCGLDAININATPADWLSRFPSANAAIAVLVEMDILRPQGQ